MGIAKGNIRPDYSPLSFRNSFIGVHAGMTEEEMQVPFITIECI
ncbi:MAG: hypothetical protein ACOX3Q_00230 [Clostridia bacterium]|jgi:hypothetical protein